jgi:hypothetical protein
MRRAVARDPSLLIKEDLLEKQVTTDGHTGNTFHWTLRQVKAIEKDGFETWINAYVER